MVELSIAMDYADRCLCLVSSNNIPDTDQLKWLRKRDLITRSQTVIYVREKMLAGEALAKATADASSE